jgi:hypothetical protein
MRQSVFRIDIEPLGQFGRSFGQLGCSYEFCLWPNLSCETQIWGRDFLFSIKHIAMNIPIPYTLWGQKAGESEGREAARGFPAFCPKRVYGIAIPTQFSRAGRNVISCPVYGKSLLRVIGKAHQIPFPARHRCLWLKLWEDLELRDRT